MFSKFFQNIQESKQEGERGGAVAAGGRDGHNAVPPEAGARAPGGDKTERGGGVKRDGVAKTTTTAQTPTPARKRRRGRVKDGVIQDDGRRSGAKGGAGAGGTGERSEVVSALDHHRKRPRIHEVEDGMDHQHRHGEQNSRRQQQQKQQQSQNPHNNRHQQHHQQQQQRRHGQGESNQRQQQPQQQQQKRRNHHHHHQQQSRPRLTPAAYELSQQLQQASKYKQLQQALNLYHNFEPQSDLDNFHACIVVDCCARCGNVDAAERIVQHYQSILQRKAGSTIHNNISSNTSQAGLSVQVQTALLKAYAHAGAMHKASRLFHDIVSPFLLLPSTSSSSSLKLQQQQQQQMPNVRTLNTLLRGCLWTATSCCTTSPTTTIVSTTASTTASTPTSALSLTLAGGVISSEEAWALYQQYCTKSSSSSKGTTAKTTTSKKKKQKNKNKNDNEKSPSELSSETSFDVSSYEASIKLLFQSLRMTPGQERLDEFMQRFGIQIKKQSRIITQNGMDASTLETLGVCFLAQAQAFAWLSLLPQQQQQEQHDDGRNSDSDNKDLWLACQRAIHAVQASRKVLEQAQTDDEAREDAVAGGHSNDKETATIDESLSTKTKKKKQPQIQGGKQAWKKESSPWTNKSNDSTTTTANDDNDTAQQQQQRIQEERRAASNVLYRKHRLDEIELEAKRLLTWRSQRQKVSATTGSSHHSSLSPSQELSSIIDFMLSKFFCFSSGGSSTTTTKETLSLPPSSTAATSIEDDSSKKKARVDERKLLFEQQQQLLVPAWYSFGLGQLLAVQEQQAENKDNSNDNEKAKEDDDKSSSGSPVDATMTTITTKPPSLTTKQLKLQLTCFLQKQNSRKKKAKSNQLQPEQKQSSSCLRADGSLDLDQVFSNLAAGNNERKERDIDIELGSGFGDWIVPQAMAFPHRNHVAVELRADRVYSILTKACTTASSSSSDGRQQRPLLPSNICTIASEAGTFLEQRLLPHAVGRIATIFVNHPEPPTQTVGQHHDVATARPPRQVVIEEEAAHMLNRSTLIAAARCLIPGRGRLVIVTDNSWYARLLCNTLVQIMVDASSRDSKDKDINSFTSIPQLVCATQSEMTGFHAVETFGNKNSNNRNKSNTGSTSSPSVTLYKGQPNASIGHFTSNDADGVGDETAPGSSYFDRLWRTGAGRHAEKTTRFVICIKRGADK